MNGNRNETTKWLQYLLYVGIATLVNTILQNIPFVSGLSTWISLAISAATVYLLFKLADSNEHYRTAAILYAVPLGISVLSVLGINILGLVGTICALVAEYMEYKSHAGLIEDQDPKLASSWGSLFWMQFAVRIITVLLTAVLATALLLLSGLSEALLTSVIAAIMSVVSLLLQLLYIRYLKRTIVLLETGLVM